MYDVTFLSEEEIVKRLQIVLRDFIEARGDYARQTNSVKEAKDLAAKLAERIYDEPQKWGVADILPEFRDDSAADAFVSLLLGIENFPGRSTVNEWYERTVESKFRRLWTLSEEQTLVSPSEDIGVSGQSDAEHLAENGIDSSSVFEEYSSVWISFESDFPRDAFALRLRYMLGRNVDQMVVMLDAPSNRAIAIRVNRARDRFKMYCEQHGLDRNEISGIMSRLPEENE